VLRKPPTITLTEDISILLFPTRYNIYKVLKEAGTPLYAQQIGDKLGLDRKLVSFHLAILEQNGFVISNYGVANPSKGAPKAVRYYTLTEKADKVIRGFIEKFRIK